MVTDEGLTQIADLIKDTGEFVKFVIYDNGCHLQKHLQNTKYEYPQWMTEIRCFIDRFHLKNHNKSCLKYSCDKIEETAFINSQVCEQLFDKSGKFNHMAKHMSKYHFIFFMLQIFTRLNENKLQLKLN